ncbi:hypothetical protein Tco_0973817 [Tanacetum coccineum]|uniref:Uncharacterized protein n=1 Tax=Tanacetum coccineum TaxID=301880 RepID=A0ABQ5E9W9_9ASTR
MNYYEPNLCYESNYSGFDHFQPPQYSVIHQPPHGKTIGELLAEERAANIDQSPPQEISIQDMEDLKQHYLDEMKSLINDLQNKNYRNESIDIQYRREFEIKIDELKQNFNGMSIEIRKKEKELMQQEQAACVRTSQWYNFIYYDDEDDEESSIPLSDVVFELPPCVAITLVLSTEEPDNSLSIGDEHLDTISATKSDEVIKSNVEDLVPIPSESEGIPDNMCDVPFRNNSPPIDISKDQFEGFSDCNDDSTLIDDDSFSIDDIDYVDASPPDSELVSLEEVKDFDPENGEIDTDILLTIKDDILCEKLLNINLLIAKIEALNANQTPSFDFVLKSLIPVEDGDSFLEKFETTPELKTSKFDIEKKNSGSTTIHVDISLPDLECFYFKSEPDLGDLTSIIDPGIRENVSSTTNVNLPFDNDQSPLFAYVVWIFLLFLTYPVTPPYLLSSGNKDTIFDPGISIYHYFMIARIVKTRARGFVLRSLDLHILSFILGIQYPNLID